MIEIGRRLIGGIWQTGPQDEAGGGGSTGPLAIVAVDTLSYPETGPSAPIIIPVPFDTVRFDPDGLWNASTFQFEIAEPGWYECGISFESGGGIVCDECAPVMTIQVNGDGQNIFSGFSAASAFDSFAFQAPAFSGITHLDAGDSIELDIVCAALPDVGAVLLAIVHTAFFIAMKYPD